MKTSAQNNIKSQIQYLIALARNKFFYPSASHPATNYPDQNYRKQFTEKTKVNRLDHLDQMIEDYEKNIK